MSGLARYVSPDLAHHPAPPDDCPCLTAPVSPTVLVAIQYRSSASPLTPAASHSFLHSLRRLRGSTSLAVFFLPPLRRALVDYARGLSNDCTGAPTGCQNGRYAASRLPDLNPNAPASSPIPSSALPSLRAGDRTEPAFDDDGRFNPSAPFVADAKGSREASLDHSGVCEDEGTGVGRATAVYTDPLFG